MARSPRTAARLSLLVTVSSLVTALLGALAMRDRVRLVDVLVLFFGGAGAGAGLAALVVQRRQRRAVGDGTGAAWRDTTLLHTPPTVPWRAPDRTSTRPPA